MNNKLLMKLIGVALLAGLVAACSPQAEEMPTAVLPAGMAYAEGKEIYFIHTEASDPEVANLLTDMMTSPVIFVPALAEVPAIALAEVYVFDNGIEGKGPLGFQPDVFDNPPGAPGYSPLRRLNVVTWANPSAARLLKSVVDIQQATEAGEVTIAQPGVVINMPFVVWEDGKR